MSRFSPEWRAELKRLENVKQHNQRAPAQPVTSIAQLGAAISAELFENEKNGISAAMSTYSLAKTAVIEFQLGRKETFHECGARMDSEIES